jgi:hypothetical protein
MIVHHHAAISASGLFIATVNSVTFIKLRQHGPRLWTVKFFANTNRQNGTIEQLRCYSTSHTGTGRGDGYDQAAGAVSAACA